MSLTKFSALCMMAVTPLLTCDLISFAVKRVKTFILHPKYNVNAKAKEGVEEFYDYDVALIQLEEDVHISSSVR